MPDGAIAGGPLPEWPYPLKYRQEKRASVDVLVLGGGIAGCHAAISAAREGMKVAVVEKGHTARSGSGGAGVDHWGYALTNPCSRISPDQAISQRSSPYVSGIVRYITMRESWPALLDVEKMGLQFRDEEGVFAGAPFRDEESKILFAYDYVNRTNVRIRGGAKVKLVLYRELRRLGVDIYDRVMATSLLTEGGKVGGRVIGATGVNLRSGEFYVFAAKATILATAHFSRIWVFSTELAGSSADRDDPNCSGEGSAMAWEAGAELTQMERSRGPVAGGFSWPRFGVGSPYNSWYPCNIVDARGKEVPWTDVKGNVLKTLADRTAGLPGVQLIPDLPERIKRGEFVLPLFADLPSMPENERRAIFGLMIGNEGKTRVPIYENYARAGFNPDKDMLQAPIISQEAGGEGMGPTQWRDGAAGGSWTGGGVVVDWDLRTSLEGLYAAGNQVAACTGGHPGAAATGRYAGRKAAAHVKTASQAEIEPTQLGRAKERVYSALGQRGDIGWKELQAGIARVMQVYCAEYKSREMLETGLWWLKSIRESEAVRTQVRNPHELGRFLECLTRLTVSEIIIRASLARKASSSVLDFKRIDYPEIDPPDWNKFVTLKQTDAGIEEGELTLNYWVLPPYSSSFKENYLAHSESA
jgi:succinate dehydrogenase/fumarate reductase flavoprotein subunit